MVESLDYSGLAVIHPQLFAGQQVGAFALAPLLRRAADAARCAVCTFSGLGRCGSP